MDQDSGGRPNSLHQLPAVADGAREYSEALEDMRRRCNEAVDQLRDRKKALDKTADQLKEHLDKLHDDIVEHEKRFETQKGRIDSLVTDQQAKFNEEQQQRNAQFDKAQKERDRALDDLIAEQRDALDKLITEKTEAADTQLQEFEKRAAEHMRTLTGHLDHAKTIVGLIGNTGMTGHYQKVANRELVRADRLRNAAIFFFVLMVIGVGWVVKEIKSDDFDWQVAVFRFGVALALLAPAIYCARESTRHRRSENRNRRIELELASINPYLDSLPEEKAQAVIEQLAARYFGNEVIDDEAKGVGITKMRPSELMSLVERIAKIFRS